MLAAMGLTSHQTILVLVVVVAVVMWLVRRPESARGRRHRDGRRRLRWQESAIAPMAPLMS
jgi:uncharacterized iron-regulated membrane protein